MNHIVDTCQLTKFESGLDLLHEADDHSAGTYSKLIRQSWGFIILNRQLRVLPAIQQASTATAAHVK